MSKDHLKEEIIINESLTLELNSRGIDLLIHEDVPNESNSTLANKNVKYRKQVKEFPIKKGMPPSSEIKKEFHKLGTLLKKWSEGSFASGVLPLKMEAELLRVLADYKVPGAEAAAKRFAVQGALSSNSRLRKLIDYHYYQKFLELDDYEAIIENKDEFKALKSLVEQCAEIFSIYFSKKKFNKFQLAGNNCLIKDRKIIWLNISKESLKNFPQEILKLKNLKKLFLKWARRITFLPEEISELRELEWLKTFDCPFKELPESIGNLKKLKTLKIRDASLTSLPNSITHLTNLKILDISFNEIEQLPEEIGMLKNLKKLILNRNKFTEIPDSITNLKKLRVLSLFALRHLEKLPKNIGNLKNLRVSGLKRYLNPCLGSEI
ncbi:MAG: leucine-rich repeat domain-containing protein [Promethearchaeota archaeon]